MTVVTISQCLSRVVAFSVRIGNCGNLRLPSTTLLIEHGQLLKPYAIPWRPDGWVQPPPGWTAADDEWTEARAAELMDNWRKTLDKEPLPEIARNQARQERGKMLQAARRPWPGWVPTNPRTDPRITRAYRELFTEMNGHIEPPVTQEKIKRAEVEWPADGHYVFSKGKMRAVNSGE